MIHKYLVLALFVFAPMIYAQQKSLVLYGKGEVAEVANRAELTFIIQMDGNTLTTAFYEAQTFLNGIFNDLKAIGLDSSAIQQSLIRVNEKDLTWFTSKKYRAVLRTKLMIDSLRWIENVLEVLGKYELEYLSDIQFSLKDYQSLNQRAYNEAFDDAKRNAVALSKSKGFVLGEVSSIIENEEFGLENASNYIQKSESFYRFSGVSLVPSILPEKIVARKTLKIIFAIN